MKCSRDIRTAHEPRSAVAHHRIGLRADAAHSPAGHDEAIAQFRRTLEMDDTFVQAHFDLGLSYAQAGGHGGDCRVRAAPRGSAPPPCDGGRPRSHVCDRGAGRSRAPFRRFRGLHTAEVGQRAGRAYIHVGSGASTRRWTCSSRAMRCTRVVGIPESRTDGRSAPLRIRASRSCWRESLGLNEHRFSRAASSRSKPKTGVGLPGGGEHEIATVRHPLLRVVLIFRCRMRPTSSSSGNTGTASGAPCGSARRRKIPGESPGGRRANVKKRLVLSQSTERLAALIRRPDTAMRR